MKKESKTATAICIVALCLLFLSPHTKVLESLSIKTPLVEMQTTMNQIKTTQEISDKKLNKIIEMIKFVDTQPTRWAPEKGRFPVSKEIEKLSKEALTPESPPLKK
ncbi:hypothetical protein [Geobacter sulfurreducens]|uniref:hypothetical protein n=1 Tax=Geobacter sulfurreducens TaxID=35554 RepID=UPI0011AEBB4A|nr:hypothetical protein [Geobacter sulfurreducens]